MFLYYCILNTCFLTYMFLKISYQFIMFLYFCILNTFTLYLHTYNLDYIILSILGQLVRVIFTATKSAVKGKPKLVKATPIPNTLQCKFSCYIMSREKVYFIATHVIKVWGLIKWSMVRTTRKLSNINKSSQKSFVKIWWKVLLKFGEKVCWCENQNRFRAFGSP